MIATGQFSRSWALAVLTALAAVASACSDLTPAAPSRDAGTDAPVDVEVQEPPDPPGPSPWTRRTSVVAPPSRFGHALAYDPLRGRVVLFGGYSTKTLRDLWEWDGQTGTWVDRTPTAIPAAWPAPRTKPTLVWDPARERVVLFGGDTTRGVWLRDVWEWDGASGTWTNRTPTTIAAGTWPAQRWGHAMAADAGRGKLVLFGGAYQTTDAGIGGAPLGDTWEWDGQLATWTERTPNPLPTEWPSPRRGHQMTWDGGRQRVVMLMGASIATTVVFDAAVWEWDGVAGIWRRMGPAPAQAPWPIGREDHGWVWDADRNRLVLFAGWQPPPPGEAVAPDPQRDLWELDPASGTWLDRTLPPRSVAWPLARASHAMVFDVARGKVLLFGGGVVGGRMKDTWEWDGSAP